MNNLKEITDQSTEDRAKQRLEELRAELINECISYEELTELESLSKYIDPNDVQLLEAAGVPEHKVESKIGEPEIQDFIEKYYPDYDHSNEIAYEGDLYKLTQRTQERGDCADVLLVEEYDDNIENLQIEVDWCNKRRIILEESITAFLAYKQEGKDQLFIISHTWKDTDMTIKAFSTNYKALKYASETLDGEFRKADAHEKLEDYLSEYWEWIRDDNDNMCDTVITYEIETI